jgi:hypothetical protein
MGITMNTSIIHSRIRNLNRFNFVLWLTLTISILAIILNIGFSFISEMDITIFDMTVEDNTIMLFISTVFIAPIVETYLCQALPYQKLRKVKYLSERNYLILLISASFFGLMHLYSLFYIVYAFLIGLVLMYGYIIRITSDKKTFILIALCHSVLNLEIFFRNLLLT